MTCPCVSSWLSHPAKLPILKAELPHSSFQESAELVCTAKSSLPPETELKDVPDAKQI